ncbi:MAG: glucose-6-phosphate dehydrogenase assembly protein OpcA [Candidatus Obscuribacterales bacterium]|nr:glucose-6-phosphate dehydrogenase assembly protein OpcA [Candidatus Obscuribacterales bacterium]
MNVSVSNKSEAVESFLSGKLAQVDVKKIEAELSKLWTQAAVSDSEEDHPQVIRACSSNLILYTDREDAESSDGNILDEIVLAHPSRAILAICREAASRKLEAWVTARCHLASGSGSKQICSEQITVLAEGEIENELISVIESLLLGDLPVFLWWTTADLCGEKLGPFLSCCRRLVVDSSRAPYSFQFLRDLQQIVESTESCVAVSDLNWRRLLGIRAAIAEEFERSPLSIAGLQDIKTLRISSCGQELQEDDCSLQSLLLTGWLADRLSWEACSFSKDKSNLSTARFKNTKNEREITVEFKSTAMAHVAPGSIYEIEIELLSGEKLRISRDPAGEVGSLVVLVKKGESKIRELLADDSDLDRVHLMGYEIEELAVDTVFAGALEAAVKLLHLLEA